MDRAPHHLATAIGVLLWVQSQPIDAQVPQGDDFQVNSYTTYAQTGAAVAVSANGHFVLAWQSYGSGESDASFRSIQAQRFAADGTPAAAQFQVNSYTTYNQLSPAIAIDSSGNFIVTWESQGSDGSDSSDSSIQGQRFAADGTPTAAQFQVNSFTTSNQLNPAIAIDGSGGFIVIWESVGSGGSDSSSRSIQGQRFAADGTPAAAQFQVNSYTTGGQYGPAITIENSGDFVVAWSSGGSAGTDNSTNSIQGQRFAANGTPTAEQFQVNSYNTDIQLDPAIAADDSGDFVVAWMSRGSAGSDNSDWSIQARRFRVTADLGDTVWEDLDFDGRQPPASPGSKVSTCTSTRATRR